MTVKSVRWTSLLWTESCSPVICWSLVTINHAVSTWIDWATPRRLVKHDCCEWLTCSQANWGSKTCSRFWCYLQPWWKRSKIHQGLWMLVSSFFSLPIPTHSNNSILDVHTFNLRPALIFDPLFLKLPSSWAELPLDPPALHVAIHVDGHRNFFSFGWPLWALPPLIL